MVEAVIMQKDSGGRSAIATLSGARSSATSSMLLMFLVLIAITHFLGLLFRLYWEFWWYDIPLHLAGGAWLGLLFIYLFGERLAFLDMHQNLFSAFWLLIGFTALVGIGWEVYEYILDHTVLAGTSFRAYGTFGAALKDFVNDILGAATLYGVWVAFLPRTGKQKLRA